ncbi:hypothetical protein [Chromobacterium sp. IIBBL 290-4]|uniref:hypothetical protein n=1 Tax=Chromobacterium sp. IIBBL 290-4 TaxID=2953890 RepID=UPI0020B7BFE1|nr:hypothetical protein [Chromobacterium sp. IIBBL 290-4]UTH75781.1 hypothetical protein NKT35_06685 [Chromobacterium sp. IIBBL 290-4]
MKKQESAVKENFDSQLLESLEIAGLVRLSATEAEHVAGAGRPGEIDTGFLPVERN